MKLIVKVHSNMELANKDCKDLEDSTCCPFPFAREIHFCLDYVNIKEKKIDHSMRENKSSGSSYQVIHKINIKMNI